MYLSRRGIGMQYSNSVLLKTIRQLNRVTINSSQLGAGPSRKGRFAALFLENRPRKNLLFLLFRPLLSFFKGLFRVEIYKLEQNRADQLFYR